MTSSEKPLGDVDRRMEDEKRQTFDAWCVDLKRRLQNVSRLMPPEELDALVMQMTRMRLKYQTRCAVPDARPME